MTSVIPARVDVVYVLSRVTLGADIKIVSPILAAMKKARFPGARIVFVANRKSAELFQADPRIEHLNADYPRSGPVSSRLAFAEELRSRLQGENCDGGGSGFAHDAVGIDSAVRTGESYFHFPSRTSGIHSSNLTDLVRAWLREAFDADGSAYIAPRTELVDGPGPRAAVNLGVGENDSKRVAGDFEAGLLDVLGTRYETIWVDRGAGGAEAHRVTAAVEASCVADRVRFWEGGFAGFASILSQCDFYVGYDSAGQHAAAAAGVPLISIFAGAPSERFRHRWSAAGNGEINCVVADGKTPEEVLNEFVTLLKLE